MRRDGFVRGMVAVRRDGFGREVMVAARTNGFVRGKWFL